MQQHGQFSLQIVFYKTLWPVGVGKWGVEGGRKRKMKKLQDANVQKRTRFIKMAIILFNNKENTRTLLETLEKKRLMNIVNKKN